MGDGRSWFPRSENGYWLSVDRPGLEVNEAAAARQPFEQEVIHATTARAHDAAVDW